jgi:arylsulfatase A-like enzyme
MPLYFFAALLAGGLLGLEECLYIIFNCGPFWMDTALFVRTILLYSAALLPGMVLLDVLLRRTAFGRKVAAESSRRFLILTASGWLLGTAAQLLLMALDMKHTWTEFIVFPVCAGIFLLLILLRLMRRPSRIPFLVPAIVLGLLLLTIGAYESSNFYYTSEVRKRCDGFDGAIPQVCLLVLDTARSDHFSCYGYPQRTTPNVDRIAEEGALFVNTFSAANWTPPGHISIFTGKYPFQHANNGEAYMPEELTSITEILNRKKYYCMAMYNNPIAGRDINLTQGFDRDYGIFRNSWVEPAPFRIWNWVILRDSGSRTTFSIAAKTFAWMGKRNAHLFLYLNITEPHAPYKFHRQYFEEFAKSLDLNAVGNLEKTQQLCNQKEMVIHDSSFFVGFNEESFRFLRARYDGELAYADQNFGAFADRMRRTGILDETLLIVTADHGEFLGEHATVGHPELLFNPVLRIPLIFRYPGSIAPQKRFDYASNVDIFPSLLTMMGYEDQIPSDVSGMNLFGAMPAEERRLLSVNVNKSGSVCALLDGAYKLIVNADDYLPKYFPQDTLLFNIMTDPDEAVNLYRLEPDIRAGMTEGMDRWKEQIYVPPSADTRASAEAVANLKALGYVH